ncbi:MAG: YidC/Oxa1 family membrane protein insertase [Patescibacteria group bacterium]
MNIFTTLLTQPLANGLILFYQIFGENLGLAITFFSVALIFLLRPLTKPSMDAMNKIRTLAPRIEKLKQKYGSDKLKFSKAQAELYKQEKINPAAGCLPQILQLFVLYALFGVFTTTLSGNGDTIAKLNNLLYQPLKLSAETTLNTKFLYFDVTKPDCFGPGKCPSNPFSLPFPLPGVILILAALSQFVSVKVTSPHIKQEEKVAKKTEGSGDDMQVAMQKSMTYTLPLMTIFFGMSFPAGLALYWFIFSLINAAQQIKSSGWGSLTPLVKSISWIKH